MKVLVVDDDVVSRMVLMHLIDSCGSFDIVEAEDGADAWQQLEAGLRPAICFCDLRMPRLSGMELLQRVKADAEISTMPLVLVTSANDKDTVQEAAKLGAAGFIVKPFQAEQVRVHLTDYLDQAAGGYATMPRRRPTPAPAGHQRRAPAGLPERIPEPADAAAAANCWPAASSRRGAAATACMRAASRWACTAPRR
jgi:two-component system chemotaxis response regulator CheY